MTAEKAVRERIVDLNTTAAERVYMLKLPQGLTTWPAVRVQLISDPSDPHLRGGNARGQAVVQVDCYQPEGSGIDAAGTVSGLAADINGDDAGSGLSGWRDVVGSPEALRIAVAFRLSRWIGYEQGEGAGAKSGPELRLVRMSMRFRVHYKTMN